MYVRRRKCRVFVRKLLVGLILACCCISLLNLVCFDDDCYVSDSENTALSSLGDVVWQANEMSNVGGRKRSKFQLIDFTSVPSTTEVPPEKKQLDVAKKLKSLHMASLDFCPQKQQFGNRTVLLGNWHVYHKKMLSVGIPSIVRKSKSYLKTTLSTIFGAVKGDEESNVTVVVLLADFDEQWKERQLTDIKAKFHKFVSNGMLQVIQAPANYYEGLQHLHRSLGDHMDRVLWRSKQALDYVFLMCYCSYVSRYYLQLEDDVIASPSFVSKIRDFIFSQKSDWISLNVALLGYIGKLYPTRELQNLASYIRLFFDEMPVDWLEPRWKKYRGQDPVETKCRAASLFQHVGLISSFRPKESQRPNTLKEHYFDQFDHKYRGLNPPAEVSSDLLAISGKPADAYAGGDGHFYARCGTGGSKVFDIFLKKPTKLRRIVVETGANFAERDYIITGSLEVSLSALESRRCVHYQSVGEFRFGRIDVSLHGRQVRCIRIKIVYQGRWMYFREIDVWSSEDQQE